MQKITLGDVIATATAGIIIYVAGAVIAYYIF